MEENKIENKVRSEPDEPKKEMTEAQRQKRKKMFVYPLLFVLCACSIWLIFAPSKKDKEKQQVGYNTEVPEPSNKQMVGDKQSAYEQEFVEKREEDRRSQMQDLASMFGSSDEYKEDSPETYTKPERSYGGGGSARPSETIYASANAYHDINRTLESFYEQPKEDSEKEEMRLKLEELNARLEQAESPHNAVDEQIALMEKSYELAAKYLPSGQNGATLTNQPNVQKTHIDTKPTETMRNGKALIAPIGQVREQIVSGLSQQMSDSAFIADYSVERNMGFYTAVGTQGQIQKNTIKACIHDNQTITDGQAVRMRLLEPMRAGTTLIPRNALVTGKGKISGERLGISITSIEYEGMIIPVEITIIDTDGQEGIFIPNSMEVNAAKEVASNMGSSLGTSVSITNQSAGDQLLTELGKGAIQGTSQYVSKKISAVKVSLKAGYQVMLLSKIN